MGWSRYFRRKQWDAERAAELASHLEIETDDNIARGMDPDAARDAARRKLGNELRIREDIYRINTIAWLDTLVRDVRFGLRLLIRTPGFTAVALLSLTLGIGANTAIFQVVDAVRLRTLPLANPEQLVEVRLARPAERSGNFWSRYPELNNPLWEQLRARQEAFSDMLAWAPMTYDLSDSGEVRRAKGLAVSGSFFKTLGVSAIRGRVLTDADNTRGCAAGPAVISYAFWRDEFGADPAIIGRKVRLDHHIFDIVGVTPASFHGIEVGESYDVAIPICAAGALSPDAGLVDAAHVWWLSAMGRIKPGWTPEKATAHLRTISPGLFRDTLSGWFDPDAAKRYTALTLEAISAPGGFSRLREQYSTSLWFLLGLSGLVLLTSCVNLANLLLARANAREREMAVRLATGAPRGRIVRQLLTESLLLSLAGTLAGLVLARGLSSLLVRLISSRPGSVYVDLSTDWRVVGFSAALMITTTLVFGLLPALRATSTPVQQVLKAGGRSVGASHHRHRLQGALVVAQVTMAMTLVVSAALFARNLYNLATTDTGHRPDGFVIAEVTFSPQGTPDNRVAPLLTTLLDRLRATPGIESVAQTAIAPLRGRAMADDVQVEVGGKNETVYTSFHRIGPGYFRTVGVPLVAGRDFDTHDRPDSGRVAIVNRTFAKTLLKTTSPVGRVLSIQVAPHTWARHTIVGMAEDALYSDIRDAVPPVAHLAIEQDGDIPRQPTLLIASRLPAAEVKAAVLRETRQAAPMISVEFSSLSQLVRSATRRDRLLAALSAGFALLALVLAAIGIYGVLSYLVTARQQEIGVRLALGATQRGIIRLVARRSLAWLAGGLVAGGVLAVGVATLLRSMLFGLTPTDPLSLLGAAAVLAVAGVVATLVPARRASRLEPKLALRED